jgi:hypothetical protein
MYFMASSSPAFDPQQPTKLRGEKKVVNHQSARTAEQPNSQNHQQVFQCQHGVAPFFFPVPPQPALTECVV